MAGGRRAAFLDVAIAVALATAQAARLAALAPGFARFLRFEFVRVATGVRRAPAGAGDLSLLFGVHAGKTATLADASVVAVVAWILVAIGHVVLLWLRRVVEPRTFGPGAGPLTKAAATFMPSTQRASTRGCAPYAGMKFPLRGNCFPPQDSATVDGKFFPSLEKRSRPARSPARGELDIASTGAAGVLARDLRIRP
jgi:hypothetical protein